MELCVCCFLLPLLPVIVLWFLYAHYTNGRDPVTAWLMHRVEGAREYLLFHRRPNRIILIRHGESMGNAQHDAYGATPDHDIQLTEKGKQQAVLAGQKLREIICDEPVRFYVSPYLRTKQTFEGIREAFDTDQCTVRYEPRLREQEWGLMPTPEQVRKCKEVRDVVGSFYYRFPGGESGGDVYDRVTTFLETLYRDFHTKSTPNVVLVSHGLTCRLFLMRFFHWHVEYFQSLENFENCEFVVMEKQHDGRYQLTKPLRTWR
eukprot:GILK01008035.1.p1 GENE.GILK01008035.1~~GILK01008035.1.p1  ORF type:complete len:261 (-),score=21.19 GILK01008035.1:132-914(-)